MSNLLKEKRILVTGCCGTIGQELVRQLLNNYSVGEVVAIDNNESELFFLEQKFYQIGNARFALGDVRDREKIIRLTKGIDIVFHIAAFKHVVLCERSPFEAVQTNILGVQNIVNAANENNVKKVIFTSSDKAVNPTSVMGTSKLMGERIMTGANSNKRENGPIFAVTRFGNVLGSRGSVVPIFLEQIRLGGPVTLTHLEMTRFVMSTTEAVSLVIDSHKHAKGGEVLITKMPVLRIRDLAEAMVEIAAPHFGQDPEKIEVSEIGVKPGEKLFEELMSEEEIRRAIELSKYFVILPAFRSIYETIDYSYDNVMADQVIQPYVSSQGPFMTKNEIKRMLIENELLTIGEQKRQPSERYWP